MKNFLRVAALAICAIFMTANASAQDNYNATTMGEKVYLETANWGQNSPFNKQIFTSYGGSTNAKAGCVPTAYAIVMRYHEFPTEGTSKTLYNCQASTYVEITDRVYDFSKMPLTNGSGWTEEQQTEVSKFFSHVLHACFPSSIGTGATTVNEGQTSKVLNDYFNYQLINASYQANFTMDQWAEKLRESISNGCPVPYAANNSGTGDTRHMFVVDGYTENGYFHFNFGWSGSGNGWFKLDDITPSQGDNYSWNGNSQHYALFNLTPNKTPRTVTATTNSSSMGTVSINGGTAGSSVSAEVTEGTKATLTAHPVDGYALANWTKNGVVVGTKNPIQVTVGESGNDYVANFDDEANVLVEKDCTFNISSVEISGANGSYCSTWTTSDGIVLSCSKGSEPAYALSTTVNTFFAKAPVGNSETLVSDITYTLTAPAGYIIKSYSFKGKSPSSSYTIDVTVGGNTTNVTNASAGVVISASDINSQSTSFVLGSTYTGRAGLSIMEDGVTVTIQSEGGASTPEPDPEPTPTTYTVTTTANPAEGGTAKFAVGTGSQKTQGDVNSGETITLYATANTGYNFVNWTLNDAVVGTSATCNVSVSQTANYVANFEAEANEPVEVSGDLEFTFTRNGGDVAVAVSGAEGVTATITATSPNTTNTATITGVWNTGGTMANSTNILCTSTNTTNASESSPITYTLTVNGLKANITAAKFTNIAVNKDGGLQQVNNSTRQCNFKLDANGETVKTLSNQNIWVTSGTENTIEFNDLSVNADGTLTIKLTIYKGTDNVGCYYGLKKITLTATEAAEPGEPTGPLAGKFFRLKVKNTSNYMNIANTSENTGSTSGVTVVAKNESSDTQVFLFEQSGDGYKLKANSGNYIKCHAWNANANTTSANDATVLTFETTGNEFEYLIKWDNTNMNNGVERDDYFKAESGYVYCDAASNAASTWVLEEVIPSNEKNLTVTFAGASWVNEASSWWEYVVTQNTPTVTVKAANGAKAIGYSTVSGVRHPYLLDGNSFTISLPANCKIVGYTLRYKGHNLNTKTFTYTGNNGTTATETVGQDGVEKTLTVTGLENNEIAISVSDQSSQAGVVIVALEITYIEEEFTPLPFKAEIEGWRDNNPNTHLGTITIGGTPIKLTPEHLTASELTMPLAEGTALAFTRKYRGFEFQGFYVGTTSLGTNPTLTAENVAAINETTPLVAKFTATDDVTLFYDDDTYSYRIPAIAKTGNGMLVAVSDYRHNLDDIGRDNHGTGTKRIDLVMRTSTDNGATWSETKTIAAGDNSKAGSYLRAFGDAAIAAVGQNIVVMAAAGDVVYTAGTTSSPNKMARIYSTDNGATWIIEEMTTKMYSQSTSLIPSGGSAFFGSGKLAVDPNFNGTGNARIYGALLVRIGTDGYNNFGVFSDDFGASWKILGGDNTNPVAKGDEPKVEILPNGQILLSARRGGGRVFRVFTYGDDKANGAGSWGDAAVNGCDNGGSNATNGEIICLDAKKPNGKPTKILLQSQPKGGSGQYDRYNVTIWYKEVSADETYTPSSIASGWTQGLEVSPADVKSAYSAMTLQENGEIAFFFEEAPCYGDDHTKGYSMVYVPLTIEEITNNNFLNPNAEVELVEFDIELTDAQGNIYRETLDYIPTDVAATLTAKYPFITLGENGVTTDNKYTNTVTLPFKVSNAETTVWHNFYMPANGTSANEFYPIYIMANAENATVVAKISEKVHYGNSQYNTLAYADKLSWAAYSVDNTLTFKFKNKLTGKFMAVNGVVSSGNADNVIYTDEANATVFTLTKNPRTNTKCQGDWAITSVYNGTTGYVCNTSANYANATNYTGNDHAGAWFMFVEAPDYQAIIDQLIADINNFGAGEGKYTANDAISSIDKDALATMPINSLNTQKENVQTVKESYREVVLTVNDDETETVPGSVSITVNGSDAETVNNKFVPANATVSILATPNPGYRFVNWTRATAQATSMARAGEARTGEVVSTENPLTLNNVTEAVSLVANFEKNKPVNVVLTDNSNAGSSIKHTFRFVLDDLAGEITADIIANKLKEKYPIIVSLGTNATLTDNGADYTYENTVELPFRVSNGRGDDAIYYNIYYPVNTNNRPNYLAASSSESTYVKKINDATNDYGDNPTYNTENGNPPIGWAIYSVDGSLTFALKNQETGKFIHVTSVATGNDKNAELTDEANATAFTISFKTVNEINYYTFAEEIDGIVGYLCSTSSTYDWATHYNSNDHPGAWARIEDPGYYSRYIDLLWGLWQWFSPGEGYCTVTNEIQAIKDALNDYENILLNTFVQYGITLADADATWPTLVLNIAPENCGTGIINGDGKFTTYPASKRAPADYQLPVEAVPAEGYHFTKWTDATGNTLSTEAKYFTSTSGVKGNETNITANFEINIYTINVTAGEGGSASTSAATVEHGSEVTLTAVANDGYLFAGWYDGDVLVSTDANYTFTATSDINYTAHFNEKGQATFAIHITVASTDGTIVTNNATGNVKAIINNIGQEWATSGDFVENTSVELVATNDFNLQAYLFDGWYKNDVLVSEELEITVQVTEAATYEARFFRGCVVIGEPKSNRMGYVTKITLADGTSLGYDASNRAVVKAGTTVKINTYIEKGYTVGNWTDVNSNVVSEDESLIIEVNEDVTYTANFEPVSYKLTVSANDDSYGTVSATSGTATGTTIKVGHKMGATITATANTGYYFVNWTKGTEVVSTSATYTIEGISEYDDMVDVEYVANFLPVENATAGVYYRIGYDGFAAAASAGAARAATDEIHTYIVSPNTGTPNDAGTFSGSWTYTKNGAYQADLTMVSTSNGTSVNKINTMNNGIQHSLAAYYKVNGVVYGVTYTVSVPENGNYKIAGYSIGYTAYQNVTVNSTATNHNNTGSIQATGLDVYSFDFTVSSTSSSGAIDITNFEVYIQQVDGGAGTPETPEPETPANRYYIQSVASKVSGKTNALLMTQETGASSIFYYADSKLLSYDKGTYVKEDGTTRGLQAVGTSGAVTITTSGETTTIAAPSYLHAVDGTTRYVDHCGSNTGTAAHANHNFVLEEVTTLPVTISSALHATFYAPVAVAIPDGVKAYVLKAEDIPGIETYAWMTSLKNGIIPANTGVIIKGAEGTYYFDIVENNDAARAEAVGNVLSGTVAKTKITEDAYILANREGKIGLYPVAKNSYLDGNTTETTVRFTNNSHKAYLPVKNDWFGEQLKKGTGFRFVYDDEETTGIEEFETENTETIYDLQGRKLSEITEPGIYIVGGKKVWVK